MFITWKLAPVIQKSLHLNSKNINIRGGAIVAVLTFLWIVLFGGNYGVLRDGVSVLPFVVAVIVFLSSLFVGSNIREMPDIKISPRARFAIVVLLLLALGLSDTHAWWGPVLQIGAFIAGWSVGRIARGAMRPVAGIILIMLMTTIAILMQPEFFRFGQLGNLTLIHLLFILAVGVFAMATIAANNVKPCEKIHQSLYTKLKWMLRVVSLLTAVLFILTESVPLFLGACASTFVMFAISVWHAKSVPLGMMERALAVTVFLFGAITTMPAISALGVLYLAILPETNFLQVFRTLL